jgi:hypothetical protein
MDGSNSEIAGNSSTRNRRNPKRSKHRQQTRHQDWSSTGTAAPAAETLATTGTPGFNISKNNSNSRVKRSTRVNENIRGTPAIAWMPEPLETLIADGMLGTTAWNMPPTTA